MCLRVLPCALAAKQFSRIASRERHETLDGNTLFRMLGRLETVVGKIVTHGRRGRIDR